MRARFYLPLLVLFVASAAINFRQARRIGELEAATDSQFRNGLPEGLLLPDLDAQDLSGHQVSVRYGLPSTKPHVIYVFRPSCVWCQRNKKRVNLLADRLSGKYDVIGLSLDREGLEEFVEGQSSSIRVLTEVSEATRSSYRLKTTPMTIVVSANGKVMASWIGAYDRILLPVVQRFFSINLESGEDFPGI